MINLKFRNEYCCSPANSHYQILRHPSGDSRKSIELAIFDAHRFAFYYWLKWNLRNNTKSVPDLITFDWHQDLVYPEDIEKEELKRLNTKDLPEISLYSWMRLNSLNDDHILSAAYLNQISDIWVVCKQSRFSSWENEEFIDLNGNIHTIRKFNSGDLLYASINKFEITDIYFDVDLDYFTIENPSSNDKNKFTFMKDNEIRQLFDNSSNLMRWIFNRINGFTIAIEPEHTGGLLKSLKYLSLLNEILFIGDILNRDCTWKHLSV